MNPPTSVDAAQIARAHELYCRLTGQDLPMRYDRQRQWFELLRAGHTLADIEHVVRYLQREILATRRNVGALKLSNLLQPDRFEEDLGISRLRVRAPARPLVPKPSPTSPASEVPDAAELERRRLRGLAWIAELRRSLS
jgi:hypothetical protein